MDRWTIYEALKDNKKIDIKEIEKIKPEEIKEGLIEYLISKSKEVK